MNRKPPAVWWDKETEVYIAHNFLYFKVFYYLLFFFFFFNFHQQLMMMDFLRNFADYMGEPKRHNGQNPLKDKSIA